MKQIPPSTDSVNGAPGVRPSTDLTRLTDDVLYRLTRRRLQDRPADPQARQANIAELTVLATEIRARIERRQQEGAAP